MKELLQTLVELEDEQKVKIGAKSGFFYCGTVGEFLKYMNEYGDNMKVLAWKIATSAEIAHKKVLNSPPTLTLYATTECNRGTPRPTLDGWNNELKRWFEQTVRSEMYLRECRRNVTEFVPLPKRAVKEIRDCDPVIDEDTKSIVIDGEECGKYWSFEEVNGSPFGLRYEVDNNDAV